ncbi:MAG: succinylglutamate desuccinylase/aspartoacylase family protein [Gammaproteobacteria bacterium]|nr:succinylglutamate desuccinylase/aspartoacylase family protein [Gammaproteobacteria bacterium]
MATVEPLLLAGEKILPGEQATIDVPVAQLHTHAELTMPVQVIRGKREGPRLFISAAIHGDELNGIEIIRRLQQNRALSRLRGTLITIPIVNVHGVINHSRYLPDRRDLNRSFPGSDRGSLANRLANLFMNEIVANATHGIDLHTGAIHRSNLPQLRINTDDPEAERLATAFGVPVVVHSDLRDGSLRQAASEMGVPMLLYEAGEALRFGELEIRAGVRGILNVMRELEMLPKSRARNREPFKPLVASSSSWVRAPESGVFRAFTQLGKQVKKGEMLGMVGSPFGENEVSVVAHTSGIIIGKTSLPLINEGDALFHIARFDLLKGVAASVEVFTEVLNEDNSDTPYDEPPII